MAAISVNLRVNEGAQPQTVTLWDSIWYEADGTADWGYALASETQNVGGLQATQALETAVILCLFSNRYCPPTHPLAYLIEAGDAMGYWGDGVDVDASQGEAPLGSLLWLLTRATATQASVMWTQSLALDALSVMVGQGSVAKVTAIAKLAGVSQIDLEVGLFARDGAQLYKKQFVDVWNQISQNGVGVNFGTDPVVDIYDLGSVERFPDGVVDLGSVSQAPAATRDFNS